MYSTDCFLVVATLVTGLSALLAQGVVMMCVFGSRYRELGWLRVSQGKGVHFKNSGPVEQATETF